MQPSFQRSRDMQFYIGNCRGIISPIFIQCQWFKKYFITLFLLENRIIEIKVEFKINR